MVKKYNKKQGLLVKLGLNPLGTLTVPVSDLVKKLSPYKLESGDKWENAVSLKAWTSEYKNHQYYTDRDFIFSYAYHRKNKTDVYCLTIGDEVHYFSTKANKPRFRIGENLNVEKINSINTGNYKINFTIKLTQLRGYVDLKVINPTSEKIIFENKELYFKSVTKQGVEKEIQKFVFDKLGY